MMRMSFLIWRKNSSQVKTNDYHIPVMLKVCVEALDIKSDGIYVDVTLGGGGHTREILSYLKDGKLYSFDQDDEALANVETSATLQPVKSNFRNIKKFLRFYGVSQVDGLLADLGVSSHQIDAPERGFSFRFPQEKLDMRMSQDAELTAADVLNTYSESDLHKIFGIYGELKNAKSLSAAVVRGRVGEGYLIIQDLLDAIDDVVSKKVRSKYLAQVFQALRIEVNEEMKALEEMLVQAAEVLKPGGRLVVMSYHSLEDRLVKRFIQKGKFSGQVEKDFYGNDIKPLKGVTRKPVMANEEEVLRNKRARSAKLRVAEKVENEWQKTE